MNEPDYPGAAGPIYRPPNPLVKVSQPAVTYAILGVTVVAYLLQYVSIWPELLGIKSNQLILQGQLWRLLTPVFLHGSPMHIIFNMYALWIMGPPLERAYGYVRFALLYFLGAYAGNVISFIFQPANSLGASTALFGLIAAQFVLLYRNKAYITNAGRLINQVVMIALLNFVLGFSGGIDNWGHLGGFLGGMSFAWFAGPLLEVDPVSMYAVDAHKSNDEVIATIMVFVSFTILAMVRFFA